VLPLLKEFLIFTEVLLGALDRLLVVLDDAVVCIVHIDSAGLLLLVGSESGQLSNRWHLLVRLIGHDHTGILGIIQRLLYDLQIP